VTATIDDTIYAGSITTVLLRTRGPMVRVRQANPASSGDMTPGGAISLTWEARHARAYPLS
jgi:hypothetical protein